MADSGFVWSRQSTQFFQELQVHDNYDKQNILLLLVIFTEIILEKMTAFYNSKSFDSNKKYIPYVLIRFHQKITSYLMRMDLFWSNFCRFDFLFKF